MAFKPAIYFQNKYGIHVSCHCHYWWYTMTNHYSIYVCIGAGTAVYRYKRLTIKSTSYYKNNIWGLVYLLWVHRHILSRHGHSFYNHEENSHCYQLRKYMMHQWRIVLSILAVSQWAATENALYGYHCYQS